MFCPIRQVGQDRSGMQLCLLAFSQRKAVTRTGAAVCSAGFSAKIMKHSKMVRAEPG